MVNLRRRGRTLLSLVVVAELLTIGVHGTLASLTSGTANPGSTVSAGTLTLSTTAGATTCQSWTGSTAQNNINTTCTALPIGAGPWYPGQQATVTVAVKNTGSLGAGDLSLYMPTCTPSQLTTPGNVASFCDGVAFTIEEVTSANAAIACFTPTVAVGACTPSPSNYTSSAQVGGPGTLTYFAYYHANSANRVALGTLAAGATRYFQLGFQVITASSPSIGNYYQNVTGTIGITWHLDEQSQPGDGNAP